MTVEVKTDGTIELSGHCGVEDAEALQRQLLSAPGATVAWDGCEHLHSAVIQILLLSRPSIRGSPASVFLRTHIAPLVAAPVE